MTNLVPMRSRQEAAAFVAALSRQLHSPACGLADPREARVWYQPPGLALFLSDPALDVAARLFAPLPTVAKRTSAPPGAVLILEGGTTPPLGLEDAERLFGDA